MEGNNPTYQLIGLVSMTQWQSSGFVDKDESRLPFPVNELTVSWSYVNFDPLLVKQFQKVPNKVNNGSKPPPPSGVG